MKKTVGELVAQQAIKDGYNHALPEGVLSSIKKVAEVHKKALEAIEPFKEPLERSIKMANSALESVKSHSEILGGFSFPTIDKDDYIIPARMVQEVRVVNYDDIKPQSGRGSSVVVASYLLPKNANWESLSIKFVDGHVVKVSYPGMKSQKFDYKDMGFINTKTNKPDLKWELLRIMADNDGALTKSKWNKKFGRNVKYELNEGLKNFFGMNSNPIPHYTKKNGYQAPFSLKGER